MPDYGRPEPVEAEHDLGNGTSAVWSITSDGTVVGLIERHRGPDGDKHGGAVMLVLGYGPTQTWTVEAGTPGEWEGLTLSPSILCHQCGHHGWIRDGRWVDA